MLTRVLVYFGLLIPQYPFKDLYGRIYYVLVKKKSKNSLLIGEMQVLFLPLGIESERSHFSGVAWT